MDTDSPRGRPITVEVFSFAGTVPTNELPARASRAGSGSLRLTRQSDGSGTFVAGESIGVLPPTDRTLDTVTLFIRARVESTATAPAVLLDRAARVSFVRGRLGTARVFLPLRCGDQSTGCTTVSAAACTVSVRCTEQNATCGDLGECVAPEVPVVISGEDGAVVDAPTTVVDATAPRVDVPLGGIDATDANDGGDRDAVVDDSVDVPGLDAVAFDGDSDVDAANDVVSDRVEAEDGARCSMGLSDCAGACVDLNQSTAHCGACGVACPLQANAMAVCLMGRCDIQCNAGFDRVGTLCLRFGTTPRQIGPISTGEVNLLRPRLTWELSAGMDGAFIELCRDRACTSVIETIRQGGTVAHPTMDLPPRSVVFWRLRGMVGAAVSPHVGPTWRFHVPARNNSGAIDSTCRPHLDLNGDGVDEIAAGAFAASPGGRLNAGSVTIIYPRGPGGVQLPSRVLVGLNAGDSFGVSLGTAGDVNGDGYGDLIVGASNASPGGRMSAGQAYLFLGGPTGVDAMANQTFDGEVVGDGFGNGSATAGDVNFDGYSDLIIGASGASPGGRMSAGTASIFYGGALAVSSMPNRVLEGVLAGDRLGLTVATAGDVNGDSYSDVITGAFVADVPGRPNAGTVSLFLGSIRGLEDGSNVVLEGAAANDQFGRAIASAGDLNGDGFSDVVVGAPNAAPGGRVAAGAASVYRGAVPGVAAAPVRVFAGAAASDRMGDAVAGAGDINGDGFADLVVGAYNASPAGRPNAGQVNLYYGNVMWVPAAPDLILDGPAANAQFGRAMSVCDMSGDGFADVVVGLPGAAPAGMVDTGAVNVYLGAMGGLVSMVDQSYFGASAGDQLGRRIASFCRGFRNSRRRL